MPPSYLIGTPGLAALVLFMRRYYLINPVRRLRDPDFLGGLASLATAFTYIWLHAFKVGDPVVPDVCFVIEWALLAVAALVTILRRAVPEGSHNH